MNASVRVLRLSSVFEPSARGPLPHPRFDPVGGMQTHTGELTRALDGCGVEQVVVTTGVPGEPKRDGFGERATVLRLGLSVPMLRRCYALRAARLVPRLAAGADLVHAHLGEDLAVVPIAAAAAVRHRVPLVVTVHTSLQHTLSVTGVRSALLRTLGAAWQGYGTRRAAAVITLTPRLARLLVDGGVPAERVRVIPSGVRPALFDTSRSGDPLAGVPRPRVLFLGRLHPQKGVDGLVRAAALVPDAQLVLAGDGPQRGRLEHLVDDLGLSHRVHFLGFVPHDEVPELLHAADVLVMPSRYEELGTALVEGMYAGLPIVASATGGVPDVIEHGGNGLLVPPGDLPSLAGAVHRILRDPQLARRFSRRSRELAESYRWEVLAGRVLDVYRQVLDGCTAWRSSGPELVG